MSIEASSSQSPACSSSSPSCSIVAGIDRMPSEILLMILSKLPAKELVTTIPLVSPGWAQLAAICLSGDYLKSKKIKFLGANFTKDFIRRTFSVSTIPEVLSLTMDTSDKYYGKFVKDDVLSVISDHIECLFELKLKSILPDGYSNITEPGLIKFIQKYPELRTLRLDGCSSVSREHSLEVMSLCRHLRKVHINTDKFLSDDTLNLMLKNNPNITHLYLSGLPKSLTDDFIRNLSNCTDLKELVLILPTIPFSEDALAGLFKNFMYLEKLALMTNTEVTDSILVEIAKFCPYIKEIQFGSSQYLSQESITLLTDHCKNLKKLSFNETEYKL